MEGDDRLPRVSWFIPRLRRYAIKERPKSWVYGNYRRMEHQDDATAGGTQPRKQMPPAPPIRSPLTRLQSDQALMQKEVPAQNRHSMFENRSDFDIMNESNERDKDEANIVSETRSAPPQNKDFLLEI